MSSSSKQLYKKVPLSSVELVKKLKDRGMHFAYGETKKAAEIFEKHISYYRLRAYWITLEDISQPTRPFKHNTSFTGVMDLYHFDTKLRNILSNTIGLIEITLRSRLNYLSLKFKSAHFHLNPNNFHNMDIFVDCFNKHKRTISNNEDEKFIQHHKRKYSEPNALPIWSYLEVSSLGELSSWIKNLKLISLVDSIAHSYQLGNAQVLIAFLDRLRILRNICAHHHRIWNRKYYKRKLTMPNNPLDLNQAWKNGNKSDISFYGIFLMIIFVLKQLDAVEANLLLTQFKNISNIYNVDLSLLGFHASWEIDPLFVF